MIAEQGYKTAALLLPTWGCGGPLGSLSCEDNGRQLFVWQPYEEVKFSGVTL